jgi:hypothetical protein
VSVGYIYDSLNNHQAYVGSIVDGAPKAGAQVSLPADAASNPGASLTYVGCQGVSTCTAVGYYTNQSSVQVPIVVQINNGTPSAAVPVPVPGDAVAGQEFFQSLACPSSGDCVAVGTYTSSTTSKSEPWVVALNGTSATNVSVNQPSNYDTASPQGEFYGVACQASSPCEAVGYYEATSSAYSEPMAATINPGSSVTTVQVPLPSDAVSNDPAGTLNAVACPASGACEAMGYYNGAGLEENVVVPITGGTPGTPITATPASGYRANSPYGGVKGLACSSASMCVAAGYFYNSGGYYVPAVAVITGSAATWSATPLPADLSTTNPQGEFYSYTNAVACAPSGPCLASGVYWTSEASNTYSGLEQVVSASGQPGTVQVAPVPSNATSPQYAYLFTGSACDAAGSCVQGGYYDNPPLFPVYELSERARLSVTTSTLPAGSRHTAYQSTLAATGAWGVYTWSVSSGRLPAGLTLNSQTGVISGTPTAAGTSSFRVEATGTGGSPAPTATQSLSVTIAGVRSVIRILGHTGLVKGSRLGVKLACSKGSCAGTVKVERRITVKHGKTRVHRMVVIGSAHYSLGQGKTRVFNVKLKSAGRRALAMAKKHHVSVTILATVNGGKRASHNEKIWTAAKKHKK